MDYYTGQSAATHYEYVVDQRPSVYPIKQQAFSATASLHGWCSMQKVEFLIDLVLQTKPQKIVEIGVWGGKSLVPMAHALKAYRHGVIYGIDPWDSEASVQYAQEQDNINYWRYVDHGEVYRNSVRRIEEFGIEDYVQLIAMTSEDAPMISDIDILHIDGNHSEETSFFDVQKWVPLVKKGGFIIFDDMTWFEHNRYTTEKAVRYLDKNCFKIAEFTDVCVWGVWVK